MAATFRGVHDFFERQCDSKLAIVTDLRNVGPECRHGTLRDKKQNNSLIIMEKLTF